MKKLILLFYLLTAAALAEPAPGNISELRAAIKIQDLTDRSVKILPQQSIQKKKPGLALLYSMLLPGMGELYAGDYSTAKYLTMADAALWGTLIGMNSYGNMKMNNYKAYAKSHAGVNNSGKDSDYYARIADYISMDEFNRKQDLSGNYSELYDKSTSFWQWSSQNERRTYRGMWKSSENAFNNIKFVAGGLLLNRLFSAINALRLVRLYNASEKNGLGISLSAGETSSVNFTINY